MDQAPQVPPTPLRSPESRPRRGFRWAWGVALCAGAPMASAAQDAQAGDPFTAGLRWSHTAPGSEPWIPRDVVFVGGGELVLAAPAVATPMLQLYASAELATGSTEPLFEDRGFAGALGRIDLAAGDDADELFALAQFGAPTASTRRTVVTRHDAEAAAVGAPFAPVWSHAFADLVNGPGLVAGSRDGAYLVGAIFDSAVREVCVERIDPALGGTLAGVRLAATSLRALVVSNDGTRVAIAAGASTHVLDADLNVLFTQSAATATEALALSADGAWFALGRAGAVDVLEDVGGVYVLRASFQAPGADLPTAVALADDGATVAVAWWNSATGFGVRCEVRDRASGTLLNSYAQSQSPSGLQNYPIGLCMTPDGERIALGLWGVGDTAPEVVLLERGRVAPLLTADLAGSPYALALSRDGSRVVCGAKSAHANVFATTGEVALFDTGERDLQLTGAPRIGSTLEVEFLAAEEGAVAFAFGLTRATPFSGRFGPLWVDFSAPHFVVTVPTAGLRAHSTQAIAADPALVGLPFAIQALELGPSGARLGDTAVFPVVL